MKISINKLQEEFISFENYIRTCDPGMATKVSSPCLFDYNGSGGSLEFEYNFLSKEYFLSVGAIKINIE